MDMLRRLAVVILVVAITSALGVSNKTMTCPLDEGSSSRETCSETCFPANRTDLDDSEDGNMISEHLNGYIEQCQVMFSKNDCGRLTWNYSESVLEERHMTITVYVQTENATIQPLSGCCEVPLSNKSCNSDVHPLPTNAYFGLTLYRTRAFGWINQTFPSFCMDVFLTTTTTMTMTMTTTTTFREYPPRVPWYSVDSIRVPNEFAQARPASFNTQEPAYSGSDVFDISSHPAATPAYDLSDPVIGRNGLVDPPPMTITFRKYVGPRILDQVRHIDAMKYNYVCIFQESKAVVMKDREEVSPYNIDSALFNRGVFEMPGYYYKQDTIYHKSTFMQPVNCTSKSFRNSSVYNMSSSNPDNSTFTCLVLWATVNDSDSVQVKCMPHNATYFESDGTPKITREDFNTAMIIIIVCSVGSTCILGVIIVLMWRCKRRYDKIIKDTRELPGGLGKMMDEEFDTLASRRNSLNSEEVADVYEYHQVKRDRNDYFSNAKITEQRLKNAIDDSRAYLNPAYEGDRFGKTHQNTSFDSGLGSSGGSSGEQSQTSDTSIHKQQFLPASLQQQQQQRFHGGDSGDSGVCVDDCDLPYLERNGLPVSPFFAINFAKHNRTPSNARNEAKVTVEAQKEKSPGNYVKRAAHKADQVAEITAVSDDKMAPRGICIIEIPPKPDQQAVISPDSGIQSGPVFCYPSSAKDSNKTSVESEEEQSPRLKAFSFADSGLPGSPLHLCTADDSSDGDYRDEPLNMRGSGCVQCGGSIDQVEHKPSENSLQLKLENKTAQHLEDESECDGYKAKDWPTSKELSRVDLSKPNESFERCDYDFPLDGAVDEGQYKAKDWPNKLCEEFRESDRRKDVLVEKCPTTLGSIPGETVNEPMKCEFDGTQQPNQETHSRTPSADNDAFCDGYKPKNWYGECSQSCETRDDGINPTEGETTFPADAVCASPDSRDLAECQTYLDKFSMLNDFERSAIEAHYLDKQALAPVRVLGRCGVDQTSTERFVKPEIA